ncbi:hypothetical protein B0T16DRAFT_447375 [Cercophora newfieldiana]|uniref:Uncharacterized protein n=1 Tax=Cercophora newfieldiana TaxID=92897 RepID=A0AA39XZY9_9PEZI|nr:hypothetical protein B0T16DRAFT_447375 [Cercophora newfieldiana]
MASTPTQQQQQQATADSAPSTSPKRPIDDEIEFVSSKPVKKPRTTCQNDQKPSQQLLPRPTAPVADMSLDHRGVSLPLFGNFNFTPRQSQFGLSRPRFSAEISPKTVSQTIPPTVPQSGVPAQQALHGIPPSTVRLDQISCLGLNGSPLAAPGIAMGQELSTNMRPQFDGLASGVSASPGSQPLAASPIAPLNQNSIPFTMFSTGNLVAMPLARPPYISYPSNLDIGFPSKAHTSAAVPALPYSNPGGSKPDHGENCLACSMKNLGAQSLGHGFQLQNVNPNHRPPTLFRPNTSTALPTHQTGGFTKSYAMPPPPNPNSSTPPQRRQLSSSVTPAPEPPRNNKRHAQNLLVDVAETVEAVFPYGEVATRHGVATSKVKEALSGVLLLPLLRYAADKRRAGQLAQERMREYRELKHGWQGGASSNRGGFLSEWVS